MYSMLYYIIVYAIVYHIIPHLSSSEFTHTGACENHTPFLRPLAAESCGRNCSPPLDLVFFKLIVRRVFFWRRIPANPGDTGVRIAGILLHFSPE